MPRFLFVLNQPGALRASHSAACLIAALIRRGATVWVTEPGRLCWDSSTGVIARALTIPTWAREPFALCRALQTAVESERLETSVGCSPAAADNPTGPRRATGPAPLVAQPIFADQVDALWLRCNPHLKHQAGLAVLAWAQVLAGRGVHCFNAPAGLWRTADKSHLFDLPAAFRPRSLLSRNRADLLNCARFLGRTVVLKPVTGFGGEQVFIVEHGRFDNLRAILDMMLLHGPVLVQEYLQAAADGDRRVLLWQGEPLTIGGQVAIYRRMRPPGDLRNNLHIGGQRARCRFNRNDAEALAAAGPYLCRHGLYLAGVDIIGGRLIEINGWAPGGIHNINALYGIRVDDLIAAKALETLDCPVLPPLDRLDAPNALQTQFALGEALAGDYHGARQVGPRAG